MSSQAAHERLPLIFLQVVLLIDHIVVLIAELNSCYGYRVTQRNYAIELLSPIGAKELELLVLLYKGNKWFTYTKTSPGK